MSNALKSYFEGGKKADLNPESERVHEERMKTLIPEIVADMRRSEKLVAEMRGAPFARQSGRKARGAKKAALKK